MKSNDLSTAEAFRPDHLDRSQWICMAKAQYAAFEGKIPSCMWEGNSLYIEFLHIIQPKTAEAAFVGGASAAAIDIDQSVAMPDP